MKIDAQYPSKYLSAADLPEDGDLALTIKDVVVEMVGQGEQAENKPIVYFQEVKKGLLCNKTNSKTITGLYGNETDDWVGKRIALFSTEVEFKGDMVLGIRVRLKAPRANGTAPAKVFTLEQAVAALADVGLTKQDLGRAIPKDDDGKARYVPERDTATVLKLITDNMPADELA